MTTNRIAHRAATLGFPLVLLLFAGMVSGCDSSEATGVDTETAQVVAEAETRTDPNPAQIRGIEALKSAWDASWVAKDAAAFAANYVEDAEFINPLGAIFPNREAIRALTEFLFNGPFAGSTQTSELRRVVFLTGTTVMVDLNVTLTDYQFLPPGLPEAAPGVVLVRIKWIVVRQGARWEILAQQMTALPPGASF